MPDPKNPLIVQGDHSVLLEVDHPRYPEARDALAHFAELVKSPEHIHTYRLTPLSIWNARSVGETADSILETLEALTKFALPEHLLSSIREQAGRYGSLVLDRRGEGMELTAHTDALAEELSHQPSLASLLAGRTSPNGFAVRPEDRGRLKLALIKLGFPTEDIAGYAEGETLEVRLREVTFGGLSFALRHYQAEATERFYQSGNVRGGSGVVVLPCGAGKTIVAAACMAKVQQSTLILVTGNSALRQWHRELLDKTHLRDEDICEYAGNVRELRPVTLVTYQMLTHRKTKQDDFTNFTIFDKRQWGLIIYDEVHLLPAPVFQITSSLQARRRLGLTATLVREDGKEDDVFALIGPKKYDVPWKEMEKEGWIARAHCMEIRLPLTNARRMEYAVTSPRQKFRVASENPEKLRIVRQILERHTDDAVLIIGMYVDQIQHFAEELNIPLIQGSTPLTKREKLFEDFREGCLRTLVVSKVANFSIDLPDAAVAVQISGMFGSRQEEAQRLGRILRPKPGANQAFFYSIVSHDTVEQDFALNRQLFLCEQGYEYEIINLPQPDSLLPALPTV